MSGSSISYNLRRLRLAKGFSKTQLAEIAKLSRPAYSDIESGKTEPRVNNLRKIADALGVGIQDVVAPIPHISSLRFRSLKTLTNKEQSKRAQIVNDVAVWLQDFNELEEMLGKKTPYLFNDFSYDERDKPRMVAEKLRIYIEKNTNLNLEHTAAINDICELLEHAGIKIYLLESDLNKFFGFSVSEVDYGPAIVVNTFKNITIERQIFTVAHELAHLILHEDSYNTDELKESDAQEKQADEFASYFLMPQSTFEKEWEENKGMQHWIDIVLHVKRIFKVSYLTILHRLKDIGAVDDSIWREFYSAYENIYKEKLVKHKEPKALNENVKEPISLTKADFAEERLSRLVKDAYEKDLISFSRTAEILNISIEEMRDRANSWAMLNEKIKV